MKIFYRKKYNLQTRSWFPHVWTFRIDKEKLGQNKEAVEEIQFTVNSGVFIKCCTLEFNRVKARPCT